MRLTIPNPATSAKMIDSFLLSPLASSMNHPTPNAAQIAMTAMMLSKYAKKRIICVSA